MGADDARSTPRTSAASDETRARLVDAAVRIFADQGIATASLLEVTRLAGQRNRGAVHYHFGSREGILVAVLDQHSDVLAHRERELLEVARARPDDDVASVVEAVVRPIVELACRDWRGGCYLRIVRQVLEQDPTTLDPAVRAAIERTGGRAVLDLLRVRMAPMPDEVGAERLALTTSFLLQSTADWARSADLPGHRARPGAELFIANLVAMAVGMLAAPLSTPGDSGD